MNTLTRRDFLDRLGKLGLMFAGGLVVPYIPKVIYSIPAPRVLSLELMQEVFDKIDQTYPPIRADYIWIPIEDIPDDFKYNASPQLITTNPYGMYFPFSNKRNFYGVMTQ